MSGVDSRPKASTPITARATSSTASAWKCARADRHVAWPQWRRQDHDAAQPDGPDTCARRRGTHFGHATTDWPSFRIAGLGVGYVPEGRRIFPNLTVEENLKVPLERPGPWTIARIYELFPRLAERKANKGRQLSGGEQEMLAIARALLLNPKLLLLDEPSQGLAPLIVQDVFRVVTSARAQGISVLLVEQNVRAAVEIADRAYVLDDGHVVYSGVAAEFAKDEERVRALAGASAEEWKPEN